MKHEEQLKLQAGLDGELDVAEAAQVEAWAARDADARALLAELRMMKSTLAANEPVAAVPESRDFYWSKIARAIEAEQASTAPVQPAAFTFSSLVRWLLPMAGIAAVVTVIMLNQPPGVAPAKTAAVKAPAASAEGADTFHIESDGLTVVWVN